MNEGISFEVKCGVVIALFAALMSISDLFAGKYGDDEILLTNEKASAYLWYQSKSIKETLIEGQSDLLKTLKKNNAFNSSLLKGIDEQILVLDSKVSKYEREKKEILLGSKGVGRDNWAQEVDGKLGAVHGAKEFEAEISNLSSAGDFFDYASLFYQISLVMGAISLVMKNEKIQNSFFASMIFLGCIAVIFSIRALSVVL